MKIRLNQAEVQFVLGAMTQEIRTLSDAGINVKSHMGLNLYSLYDRLKRKRDREAAKITLC